MFSRKPFFPFYYSEIPRGALYNFPILSNLVSQQNIYVITQDQNKSFKGSLVDALCSMN